MNYSIIPTPDSKRRFKQLAKKHHTLKEDLQKLIDDLQQNPKKGTHLGHGLFKVRMPIASKDKGKSGGARVITFLVKEDHELYLVYIYDKSQLDNLKKDHVLQMLKNANLI